MAEVAHQLDLTSCDREPIHIPGSIQPHGILLVIDPGTRRVIQAAGNTAHMIGRSIAETLAASIDAVLSTEIAGLIRPVEGVGWPEPIYLGSFAARANPDELLDITAHSREGLVIVEIEPAASNPESAAQTLAKVRRIGVELDTAADLLGVLQVAVLVIRRLIDFDRVMIYNFLDDATGSVVAENRAENLDPLLNHHYPASDIPKQARALYLKNLIRVIPDVNYVSAPLVPEIKPKTGKWLDMSDCSLRSVSPVHVQYLKNMGVTASMSVSIVVDGQLWGLLSCHHRAPRLVPYELRETCKHIGHLLSQQVKAREELERQRQVLRLARARDEFLRELASTGSLEERLLNQAMGLRSLLPCDGTAVVFRGQVSRNGHVPDDHEVGGLLKWLISSSSSEIFATNSLARDYAAAESYASIASGLLACIVDRDIPLAVLWFRAEQIETINWAGNPHKAADPGSQPGLLTPRRSFDVWKETVRHQAQPWSQAEIDAARRFGQAVFELRQQNTVRELNLQLRRTLSDKEVLLTQKDLLMQEVNHRVQNSLQLVTSMLRLQAQQTSDPEAKAKFEEASRRIVAVSTVHRRLWRSDHIQNVEFGAYVEELRDGLLESWGGSWAGHIKVDAAHVLVPTNQAVVLALVLTELLTNAIKYAYEGRPGPIEIKVRQKERKVLQMSVTDEGIGMRERMPGNGFGSKLVQALVSQMGGELDITPATPGTSVVVTVPMTADVNNPAQANPA